MEEIATPPASPASQKNTDELMSPKNVMDVVIDTYLPNTELLTESEYQTLASPMSPKIPRSKSPSEQEGSTKEDSIKKRISPISPKMPRSVSPSEKEGSTKEDGIKQINSLMSPKTPRSKSPSQKEGSTKAESIKKQISPMSPKMPHSKSPSEKEGSTKGESIKNQKSPSINVSRNGSLVKEIHEKVTSDSEVSQSNVVTSNINKIAEMSKTLTSEAKALRDSIKYLSDDITRSRQEFCRCGSEEDVNFPYHLFLIEIIVNKIHMKCECFDIDYNNLVISATFLGKQPIILYDSSYGKIENFGKLNVGKSTMFAMTYDKICNIKEFEIALSLTKQPPCSPCVTKIGQTLMDYTSEFIALREELCCKWKEQRPTDNILCTSSTPLSKNMYYLSCGTGEHCDTIGIIEVTVRMSFLGKEITTAFCAQPKPRRVPLALHDDHGMEMYSCQRVEMDDQGKILLEEGVMANSNPPALANDFRSNSPNSHTSSEISKRSPLISPHAGEGINGRYDEIYTKMNVNELKIRVPKSSKVERTGKYDKIQELCSCESTAYNTGEQIQFDLPRDYTYPEKTYASNLKYTLKNIEKPDKKDRKIVNVTPTNCPVPVDMSKMLHPQKDVFILKIGKKFETKDKKTDLEIELVTPKLQNPNENKNISAQCSSSDVKKKSKSGKEKGKGKNKDKKGKGGKASKKSVKAKKSKGKKK